MPRDNAAGRGAETLPPATEITCASPPALGREVIETPDKENAVYLAATIMPISDTAEEYPALVIGNFVMGGSTLASRLGDRVRQNEGLSYGVGSFLRASRSGLPRARRRCRWKVLPWGSRPA